MPRRMTPEIPVSWMLSFIDIISKADKTLLDLNQEIQNIMGLMANQSKNGSKHLEFLMSLPLFKNMASVELDQIATKIVSKKYKKGEILPLSFDGQSRLYMLHKGQGKLVKLNYRGEELVLRFVKKSDVISSMHFSRILSKGSIAIAKRSIESGQPCLTPASIVGPSKVFPPSLMRCLLFL